MNIQKTKDYKQFKTLKGNRGVNRNHLVKLTGSIAKNNMLEVNPIIVNKKFEVIDGQHRLKIAKDNNWDIYYVVVDDASLKEVQLLNANTKIWGMQDYLDSYIELGYPDYIRLQEIVSMYDLPILHACQYLMGLTGQSVRKHRLGRDVREGEFKITNEAEALEVFNLAADLEAKADYNLSRDRYALASANRLLKLKVDLNRLFKKLEESGLKLKEQVNTKTFLRQLEDIYNRGQGRNITRFV